MFFLAGMKRSAHGILVVHAHGHPHVLLIRIANTYYKLSVNVACSHIFCANSRRPGGKIKPDESDEDGLKRKLSSKLSPVREDLQINWEVNY